MKALENLAADEFLPVAAEEADSGNSGFVIQGGANESQSDQINILPALEDLRKGLNLPKSEFKAPTKEEREREVQNLALSKFGAAIGSATNIGDIAKGLGDITEDVTGLKKLQRIEEREVAGLVADQQKSDYNLAVQLLTLQVRKEEAKQRKDANTVDLLELQIEELEKSFGNEKRKKQIEQTIDQLVASLTGNQATSLNLNTQ